MRPPVVEAERPLAQLSFNVAKSHRANVYERPSASYDERLAQVRDHERTGTVPTIEGGARALVGIVALAGIETDARLVGLSSERQSLPPIWASDPIFSANWWNTSSTYAILTSRLIPLSSSHRFLARC